MKTRSTLAVVATAAILTALLLGGCGNKTKTVSSTGANGQVTNQVVPNVHFAKTKFVLHTGLAFGAFHRYIYKPFRAGAFKKGAPGRVKALAKAAAAGLFAVHELKAARRAAESDDKLRKLAQPLGTLTTGFGALAGALKGGGFSPGDIVNAAKGVTDLGQKSSAAGAPIKERSAPVPG